MKKNNIQITLDILMVMISLIMTALYLHIIITENVMIAKKVIAGIWGFQIFLWSIKLWHDLQRRKMIKR